MSELDFVVVGAQRAGSTELSAAVAAHPEIFLCPDEVPYFEDPFFANSARDALDPVFADARPGQVNGIHCPSYLGHPEAAPRIADHAPEAKIVAVLREPVSRAVSLYFWYVQFGMLPLEELAPGMERLLAGWSDPAYPHAHEVLEWGFYGKYLEQYRESFAADRVLVLLLDDLTSGMRPAWEFLGVDPDRAVEPPAQRRNAGVYDLRRLRLLRGRARLAFSWSEVTAYEYTPRRRRKPLRFIPNAAIVGFDRYVLGRVFGNEAPALPADLDARLHDLYADDLTRLESLIDRDLSIWRVRENPRRQQGGPDDR